ncbi:glycosyltransferase family 4 protein [Thermanaerothrix sp. 4228-RoL]|uniref:Glycosyltransferase family 4 protein n=2 Tax=Thermanaerothrix TaxID=1077886 RepID=A0ABU3NP16_9CHLR|nr:glycosyltransferase family 4 protein [Thermanaerothrix sp. 4228-RoL]MDT8898586.1 glycosyltransferase family 4 protein [Thermanaerothrix sp. 4228-RoL]
MKFHFLLTQDLSSPGGLGRYLPWAKELTRLGHCVRISATHSNYKALHRKKLVINDVEVEYIGQMHVLKKGSKKTYYSLLRFVWVVLNATLRLSWAAMKYPTDVIIVGKPHPMNGIAGILGSKRWRCLLVVDVDDDEEYSGNFRHGWQRKIVGWFQKKLPIWADQVTTNTHYMRQKLQGFGVPLSRVYYLPNGVEPARFPPISAKKIIALKNKLGVADKKIIVYLGSIALVNHPLQLLIEAFIKVHRSDPETTLLLVGGGESIDEVRSIVKEKEIESSVILIGRVPPEEVAKYYAIANVSVDPVYDDLTARGRCPLKLFESWICGVPFVTGDVGDRRLLAGDPPAIKICKPGDPDSLAASIIEILNNKELADRMIELGKERVKEFYWDSLIPRFLRELVSLRTF